MISFGVLEAFFYLFWSFIRGILDRVLCFEYPYTHRVPLLYFVDEDSSLEYFPKFVTVVHAIGFPDPLKSFIPSYMSGAM